MTTYFVTGGFGFLGQHIVQALLEEDPANEIYVLGRTARQTFLGVEKLPRVHWIQAGLSQPAAYTDALRQSDAVIHAAAKVSFRKADAEAIYQANVLGTRALRDAALQSGVKNFIFISSISAVGRAPTGLSDENLYPDLAFKRQHDMYGYSKLVNEDELRAVSDEMRVVILNPSVILGPGSELIAKLMRRVSLLPIVPMPSYVNSFVDARDVAYAVVLSLQKGRSGERYLVTTENVDMLDFTRQVLQTAKRDARVVPLPKKLFPPIDGLLTLLDGLHLNPGIRPLSHLSTDKRFSTQKIRAEMGWEPHIPLAQSIADTLP